MKWKRIVLKLSGETLLGEREYGIDPKTSLELANRLKEVTALGTELAIVIGAGNIFRGEPASKNGMERATADYMGMLATVINALALQDALEKSGVDSRVMTAIAMPSVAEPYIRRRAIRHLEKGRVIILAAGTGHPYFSTDTNAVLRALEIDAHVVLKATSVDGVYDTDPKKNPDAKRYETLTIQEALEKHLKVMDAAALALARDNAMPIVVFNVFEKGSLKAICEGEHIGTFVEP